MKLAEFLRPLTTEQRTELARRAGTSFLHLRNVAFSSKKCGIPLAVALERETGGAVRRWELRDDWWALWPELVGAPGAPAVPAVADERIAA